MTPNDMAGQLVAAGQALIAVLDDESAALAQVQINRVAELREKKESAAASYESIVKALGKHPDVFNQASPAARQALVTMKDALDNSSLRNINALRAALELNRRLVQTIAASVNQQRITAAGYTKTGAAYGRAQSGPVTDVVPLSLNETL